MINRILAVALVLGGLAIAQEKPAPPAPRQPHAPMHMGGPEHFAGMERHRFGSPEWWKNPEIVQEIGISDTQVQKLDQLALDQRLKMIDLRAAAEREEVRLRSLMEAANPDENQIMGQIDKVSTQRTQVEKAEVQYRLATRRVLTPEQWKKFQSMKPARMEMRHSFVERHEGKPGPRGFMRHSEKNELPEGKEPQHKAPSEQ